MAGEALFELEDAGAGDGVGAEEVVATVALFMGFFNHFPMEELGGAVVLVFF